jgi:hypothetical protein
MDSLILLLTATVKDIKINIIISDDAMGLVSRVILTGMEERSVEGGEGDH